LSKYFSAVFNAFCCSSINDFSAKVSNKSANLVGDEAGVVKPHFSFSNNVLIQPCVVCTTGNPAAKDSNNLFGEKVSQIGVSLKTQRETNDYSK